MRRPSHRSSRDTQPNSRRSIRLINRRVLGRVGQTIFPEREHVAIRVGHHGHDTPGLLGRLGGKANAPRVKIATEVQQIGNEERNAGVPANQRLRLGMDGGMYSYMRFSLEKLRPERSLLGERKLQRIAIKLDGASDIVDEDGDAVERRIHTGFRIPGPRLA
jgi:hypothetical protein